MKTFYENYNDLEEYAKKMGLDIDRLSDNKAVISEEGAEEYTFIRNEKGWRLEHA